MIYIVKSPLLSLNKPINCLYLLILQLLRSVKKNRCSSSACLLYSLLLIGIKKKPTYNLAHLSRITLFDIERCPGFIGTSKTRIKKQKAGPIRPAANSILKGIFYFFIFLLIPATPIRPRPKKEQTDGFGYSRDCDIIQYRADIISTAVLEC